MQHDFLVKISFIVSIFGIIGLFIFSDLVIVKETDISNISKGKDVKITGEIVSVKTSAGVSTISLRQNCSLDIVVFENISKLNFSKGEIIKVTGNVDETNCKKTIYADEIVKK